MQIAASGETRWPTILAVLLVGCGLSTTAIILRLITRFAIIRTAGPDDYIIGVAQVWSSDTEYFSLSDDVSRFLQSELVLQLDLVSFTVPVSNLQTD